VSKGEEKMNRRAQEKKVESVKTLAYKLLLEYVYFKNKQLTDESTSRQRLRVRIVRLKTRDLQVFSVSPEVQLPKLIMYGWSPKAQAHNDISFSGHLKISFRIPRSV
jgi:hypothetical protein